MKSKKKLILIFLTLALLLVGMFIIARTRSQPSGSSQNATETDQLGTVIVDNTDSLSNILLSSQYDATYTALVEYIQNKIDSKIEHATLVGQPKVEGTRVSFTVKAENPTKQFGVVIDRPQDFSKIVFSVPNDGYSQTLQVYKSGGGD